MNDDLDSASNILIYKVKRGVLALNIFSLLFIMIAVGIPLVTFVLMMVSFFRADKELGTFAILSGCILAPVVVLLIFYIIQMTMCIVMSFFFYIKISPDGIEQKNSPYKHIRCDWSNVDKLGKSFLFADVIYLQSYEVRSFSLSLKSPFRFLRPKQGFITLRGYEGWPDGQLANDLKQYVPKLFDIPPTPQVVQSETNREIQAAGQHPKSPGTSQEIRLLAAISHASVLFYNIGLLVPAVIYLTQRRKSFYLGFQALQALIWQIVMFVFSLLTSSCLVGLIFIPILLATVTQNENLIGSSGGGILIAAVIIGLVSGMGYLGFTIYGFIGAIMSYQGKEFRYILIGNLITKTGAKSPNEHKD